MKRLFLILLFIVLVALPCLGAVNVFTTSVDNKKTYKNAYRWTSKPKDLLLDWAQEVEDRTDGTTGNQSIFFSPTDTVPTATKGRMYYNLTGNQLRFYNGSSWVILGTSSSGDSLDTAYNNGVGITVDNGAVTLTAPNANDNVALAIVQSDTTSAKAFTLTNAGSGNTIDIQGSSGNDIDGTGNTWKVTTAGALTCVGVTTTGELLVTTSDVLFDDTYDVAWDTSADMLIFQDNAVLGLGGDHDGAADITITGDGTNVLIEAVSDDWGQVRIGSTNAADWAFYGSTNSNIALFDVSASELLLNGYDIRLSDDDLLTFGDSSSSDSFVMDFDETTDNLVIVATTANDAVQIGDAVTNTDLKMMGTTAGDFVIFDASGNELFFEDCDLKINEGAQIEFSVADDSIDWTIDISTDETLLFLPSETDGTSTFNIGDATNTSDVRIFGETASTVLFDASGDRVIFGTYDIEVEDTANLIIGSDDEFVIDNSTETLRIIPSDTTDDFAFHFGSATNTMDIIAYCSTGGETLTWDAGADSLTVVADLSLFTMTGTTLPFHVNVTGTVSGEAAKLETTVSKHSL